MPRKHKWDDDHEETEVKFKKKDPKRSDYKKDAVRKARKNKRKSKMAWMDT